MKVAVTVELISWVCSFGADARVLGPSRLADEVQRQMRAALAWYDRASA